MLDKRPNFPLTHQDVPHPQFREEILPHARRARALRLWMRDFDRLSAEDAAFSALARSADKSEGTQETLMSFAAEIRDQYEQLQHSGYVGKHGRRRMERDHFAACNEVIQVVNRARVRKARLEQDIPEQATSRVIVRAQIVLAPIRDDFERPISPPMAHQDLGLHPVNREGLPSTPVTKTLLPAVRREWKEDPDKQMVAQSVARLLPMKILHPSEHTPAEFRNAHDTVGGIMEVTEMVTTFKGLSSAELRQRVPTPEQYAKAGPDQQRHVHTYVQMLVMHYLSQELESPYVTKASVDKLHLDLNKELAELIKLIGKERGEGLVRNALLMNTEVCQENAVAEGQMENPEVLQALTLSRLSTSLTERLGLFDEGLFSEHRAAEMMRNVVFNRNREVRNENITHLIAAVHTRFEDGEMDAAEIFSLLSTVEYSDEVVKRLCDAAFGKRWSNRDKRYIHDFDEDLGQRLYDMLSRTPDFAHHRKFLARKLGYDTDVRASFQDDELFYNEEY